LTFGYRGTREAAKKFFGKCSGHLPNVHNYLHKILNMVVDDEIESKSNASDGYEKSLASSTSSKVPTALRESLEIENSDDSSFDIAVHESKLVYRSKLLVLTVILLAATAFGATTYIFIRNDEVDQLQSDVSLF
jgi:hypothetical protein